MTDVAMPDAPAPEGAPPPAAEAVANAAVDAAPAVASDPTVDAAPPEETPPEPPSARAQLLMDIGTLAEKLLAITEAENAILRNGGRPARLLDKAQEKTVLARTYSRLCGELRAAGPPETEAERDVAVAIKDQVKALDDAVAWQHRRLEIACGVTEGLISAIGRAVVEQRQPVLGYGRDAGLRVAASGGASFAVDRDI